MVQLSGLCRNVCVGKRTAAADSCVCMPQNLHQAVNYRGIRGPKRHGKKHHDTSIDIYILHMCIHTVRQTERQIHRQICRYIGR